MNNPLIWVHGDCLSPENPALLRYPGQPALWVWDEELIQGLSRKRLGFIYECLLELPVVIRRGGVATEILDFAKERGAASIVTTDSPSPRFREICAVLQQQLPIEIAPVAPFVEYEGHLDLRSFSRYWRKAQGLILP
jgi:hypothetical protein